MTQIDVLNTRRLAFSAGLNDTYDILRRPACVTACGVYKCQNHKIKPIILPFEI